jgi:hypothetical protein
MKHLSVFFLTIIIAYVAESQNIGIGTTTPASALHVFASSPELRVEATNAFSRSSITIKTPGGINDYLQFIKNGASASGTTGGISLANLSQIVAGADGGAMLMSVVTNNPMYFFTNATERMRITGNGNIGINQSSPDASSILDIQSVSKGILIPRMQFSQRPTSPATGLLIYQTDNDAGFYFNKGTSVLPGWTNLGGEVPGAKGNYAVDYPASSGSFNVPSNVTRIFFELVSGGGGKGGYYSISPTNYNTGGGGGGGGFISGYFDVVPGQLIGCTVGSNGISGVDGSGGTSGTNGTAGGSTIVTLDGVTIITVPGGLPGNGATSGGAGFGGLGALSPTTSSNVKTISFHFGYSGSGGIFNFPNTIDLSGEGGFVTTLGVHNVLARSFININIGGGAIAYNTTTITPYYGKGQGDGAYSVGGYAYFSW